MASDQARELRHQGINAAKAGQKDLARQLLQQSIRIEPRNEAAWLWLASVARDPRERLFCLQKILEINPENEQAIKALRMMEAQSAEAPQAPAPAQTAAPKTESAPPPKAAISTSTQEMLSQAPGVPIPSRDAVVRAFEQAEPVVQEYQLPLPDDVRWSKKSKGRAGERDIWLLRGYVTGGIVAALLVSCGILYFVVTSNNIVIGPNGIAFNPTRTPIPTMTLTPTPGVTPTPSPTPRIAPRPSATIPPLAPTADVYSPEATDIYPAIFEAPLKGAINLLESGNAQAALPTLAAERANTSARFNPNPYYYEALAQAQMGNHEGALQTLEDAEGRLEEAPNDNFKPLVDAGFASIYLMQAETAFADDDVTTAQELLVQAEERAASAAEGDPQLAAGHLLQARALRLSGNHEGALEALDAGLAVPNLQYDTNLLAEKASLLFQGGDYQAAADEATYTLYLDPTVELAYRVQAEAALRQNRPGLAVLLLQGYLLYYPGSTYAYRLQGDARAAEGNYDLAIDAYTRALSADQDEATTLAAYIGRANVYTQQQRYDLALDDFAEALERGADDQVRLQRMETAYHAGEYEIALRDAEALEGSEDVAREQIAVIHAGALIEQAEADDDGFTDANMDLVERELALDSDTAQASEYLARAHLLRGETNQALDAIDDALEQEQTVMRHYVRGLILEQRDERNNAIREYEWALAWSTLYPFPLRADVEARLEDLGR
ncbi:MAG: tetratricopeptide repeat protein [Anaerolineae bacterium]|nr:tetratricopeptide repeat protein [Anaerolineae bacterium]